MKLATNPDIRPHLMRERGRPRNALVWLVTKYPSSSESWQAKAIAGAKSNGEAALRTLGRFWVRSKHAPNPTHGDADGWPPESASSWVWGKLLAETPAVCEGVTFAIPGQRVLVGEP